MKCCHEDCGLRIAGKKRRTASCEELSVVFAQYHPRAQSDCRSFRGPQFAIFFPQSAIRNPHR